MKRFLALCSVIGLTACDSPSGPGSEILPWLQGSWEYAATQTSPQLEMTGTLAVAQQIGDSLSGSIEYIEVDAQGNSRSRTHLFTGRVRNSQVTINAYVGNRVRTHIGSLVRDSMAGTFDQPINDTQSYTGSFMAVRQ